MPTGLVISLSKQTVMLVLMMLAHWLSKPWWHDRQSFSLAATGCFGEYGAFSVARRTCPSDRNSLVLLQFFYIRPLRTSPAAMMLSRNHLASNLLRVLRQMRVGRAMRGDRVKCDIPTTVLVSLLQRLRYAKPQVKLERTEKRDAGADVTNKRLKVENTVSEEMRVTADRLTQNL